MGNPNKVLTVRVVLQVMVFVVLVPFLRFLFHGTDAGIEFSSDYLSTRIT
jgi:hypothetical protein